MTTAALIARIIHQMKRDRRTLALLFLAPLFVLTLMYFIFNSDDSKPTIVTTNIPNSLVEKMEQQALLIEKEPFSIAKLKEEQYDAWLRFEQGNITLTLLNDEPSLAKQIQFMMTNALQSDPAQDKNLTVHYVYGDKDTALFDIFSPMLIGFFVFFFVFLISGIALLKERTSGTLERLLATPIRRFEIVFGYLIGYGLFALVQTIVIVLYGVYVLDIVHVGSIWLVIFINVVVALVSLSLGTLLSSFASSEFQMMQFIPLVIVPQVFFSGIFPLDSMAEWLQYIGKTMPLYYAADALNGVMYKGSTFAEIWLNLIILIGFAVVFILLNIVSLKKYRIL